MQRVPVLANELAMSAGGGGEAGKRGISKKATILIKGSTHTHKTGKQKKTPTRTFSFQIPIIIGPFACTAAPYRPGEPDVCQATVPMSSSAEGSCLARLCHFATQDWSELQHIQPYHQSLIYKVQWPTSHPPKPQTPTPQTSNPKN